MPVGLSKADLEHVSELVLQKLGQSKDLLIVVQDDSTLLSTSLDLINQAITRVALYRGTRVAPKVD